MKLISKLIGSAFAILMIAGLLFPGDASAYANLSIPNSSFSSLTLTGPITGNMTPSVDNTYDVGSTALRWRSGYFGTSLASPAISVTSTGAGIALYNTTDQATAFEKLSVNWGSNVASIEATAGTGATPRVLKIGTSAAAGGAVVNYLNIRPNSSPAIFQFVSGSFTGTSLIDTPTTIGGSSGVRYLMNINPTINQSGTAGYTALLINPTQTATGSGEKLLADFQVGGTSQLKIDNAGHIYAGGSYASLAEGDGYYFGDTVRGIRYLSGDDFEFRQWHVGGQFYQTSFNGTVNTRYVVHDAPTKRTAFSSTVDLRNYTPNTSLEVIGTASATTLVVSPGSAGTPSIQFSGDSNTGIYSDADNAIAYVAGGQVVFGMSNASAVNTSRYTFRPTSGAGSNTVDIGTSAINWRHGFFGGQVSSTSIIASATGTIGRLGLGNNQDHDFATALMKIKHTPSQAEAATLDYIQMTNTSSTRDMAISFLDDTETNSILRISAFGRNYASGDFGFSPANMAFFETVSGTVMLAGDGVAVFNAAGVFRPITGLGFGNNDNIDPFNATASTTISNGNMASASLDFPNSAAAGTQDLTITVNGATDGDECQLGVPNALASRASEAFTCFVSAANTITVRRTCVAGAGCGDPGSATVKAGFFSRQ